MSRMLWYVVVMSLVVASTVACGKKAKERQTRSGSSAPPIGPVADQSPSAPSTNPMQPPSGSGTTGSEDSTGKTGDGSSGSTSGSSGSTSGGSGSGASDGSTPSTPSPEVDFQMVKSFVTDGGERTGYLPDGRVYFASDQPIFFAMSYQTIGDVTQAIAEIHAKSAMYLTKPEYTGAFHTGTCSNIGPRYQHVAGDATPGKSEFFIVMKGTGASRRGTGIAQFALSDKLIFVIQFGSLKACLSFAKATK